MNAEEGIDYTKLLDKAMYVIVYEALKITQTKGLPGDHHFFISFATNHKGVKISKKLLEQYPSEMTIVLQHQFSNLNISNEHFEVSLSFNGKIEHIYVPFDSVFTFADPSVPFALQFKNTNMFDKESEEIFQDENDHAHSQNKLEFPKQKKRNTKKNRINSDISLNSDQQKNNVVPFPVLQSKNRK